MQQQEHHERQEQQMRDLMVEQQQQIAEQHQQIAELRSIVANAIQHPPQRTSPPPQGPTTINITQNNNNNNIVINSFGNEDLSYLDPETMRRRSQGGVQGAVATALEVHLNSERPENQNVKMLSTKRDLAAMLINNVWQPEPTSVVVDRVLWNGFAINRRLNPPPVLDGDSDEATVADHERQIALGTDMMAVRQHHNCSKGPIVRARQQVRARLSQQRLP